MLFFDVDINVKGAKDMSLINEALTVARVLQHALQRPRVLARRPAA